MREKYGVLDEWVLPFEVIPIIDVPEYGNMSAVKACEDLKIQSQNDTVKLAEAKSAVYMKVGDCMSMYGDDDGHAPHTPAGSTAGVFPPLPVLTSPLGCFRLSLSSPHRGVSDSPCPHLTSQGFNEGTMIVGPHAGSKVSVVKPIIKAQMVAAGQAMIYSEPEKQVSNIESMITSCHVFINGSSLSPTLQVISRSGDDCVVALTDQWYILYGEEEWREATQRCLDHLEVYSEESRSQFTNTLGARGRHGVRFSAVMKS